MKQQTGRHRVGHQLQPGLPALTVPEQLSYATRRSSEPEHPDEEDRAWSDRALCTLAGVAVLAWSFRLSGYLTFAPWLAVAVSTLSLAGLLAIVAAWLPDSVLSARRQRQIGRAVLAAAIIGLALWSYFQVYVAPGYGTDEIAFDQYAARLVLHGINPYVHSMAAAFPLFHVSPNGYTFLLNGQAVTSLSYPALSFEAYLPLLALGVKSQAAVWVNVAAWAVSGLVLYAVLPKRLAPVAAIAISLDVYIGYAVGGITDFLFVPLLIGAAAGWDRFPRTRGLAAWRGPILLGLAMAIKQTPWLIVPFVLAGIVLESRNEHGWPRALRDAGRYGAIAAGAFLVPNLPFIVLSPAAWLRGVLTPLSSQTVPAGQGLISLSLALPVGGGSLRAYTLTALVVFAATLLAFVAFYPLLKPAAFLLPSIVLFFAARSFGSYLIMLIPPALAAAATVRRAPATVRWRRRWWVATGGVAASGLAIANALTSASPLAMSIAAVRTTGQLATVQRLQLSVANNSGGTVHPYFTIEDGMTMTAFWRRIKGPPELGPHESADYTIQAPNYFAMPSISNGFQVVAFSTGPPAVSRTTAYDATVWRVLLTPDTFNQPVTTGQVITVRAQVVNRLNQPVHAANLPLFLGQVTYTQHGQLFSHAVINQSNVGQTPVRALTNANGVATFTIHTGLTNPIYFEANLVNSKSGYPYGYSPILAIRFRP